jgi:hypothetical protein
METIVENADQIIANLYRTHLQNPLVVAVIKTLEPHV